MQLPQIQMTSLMGKIAIEQSKGDMDIVQPKAEMTIEQPKAVLSMQTTKGTLTIDQSQAWEETNLMGPIRLSEKIAQEGKQAALEGVQRRAEQGAQLIDIHLGGNVIKEQAIQNGHPVYKEPQIAYIPSPLSVKIQYQKGQLQMDVETQKPIIDVKVNKPHINFQRGDVHVSVAQHPSLTIDFEHLYG